MSAVPSRLIWPKKFLWGVSTSSYQIEGAVKEDGRGTSIWDTRCTIEGKINEGHTGDVTCDHYHRYREDVALMKDMGLDAYRFSVAWPRILPQGRGAVNAPGLDFYDHLIDAVLEAGIEPWLCLYHWDLPQALMDTGGWMNRDTAHRYADYAAVVARRFGDRVSHWVTFNEPSVFTIFGYAIDWGAPGICDRAAHLRAIHHVNLAHGLGVDVVRDAVPGASIGAAHNRQAVLPETDTAQDRAAAELLDEHWNLAFPDPQILAQYPPRIARAIEPYVQPGDMARICRPLDWFGINHYGPIFARHDPDLLWNYGWGSPPADAPRDEVGWPIFPDMFREELLRLTGRYRLPIYVTENGYGGNNEVDHQGKVDDPRRVAYLRAYIEAMHQAIGEGADVRGYFVWSLLDAFEWGSGFTHHFGLVHVDFDTFRRTPKTSATWYAELIANSRIESFGEPPSS